MIQCTNVQRLARDIWHGVQAQPGRVALAGLAISIGIASLTVLVALLGGLERKSRRMVQDFGINIVAIVQQDDTRSTRDPGLQERHAQILKANFPDCTIASMRRYSVRTLGTLERLTVIATDHTIAEVRQWRLHRGRFLDENDLRHRERHAVISRQLSERWKWGVGDTILLHRIPFTVVGIVNAGGGPLESEITDSGLKLGEHLVFVPSTVRPDWVTKWQKPGPVLDALFMRIPATRHFEATVADAQRLLSQPDRRLTHISWVTSETLIRGIRRMQTTIKLTVGSIAVLCLILGGTTLMSLMVANVRDRVTEIGLRRSLGATSQDIALLFVVEAGLVTLAAGVIGTAAAHLLLYLARARVVVPLELGLISAAVPVATAILMGILFSWWPARSAAAIVPAEALRND